MKRLLIVDDEPNVLLGMKRYFRSLGFEVDGAEEREEAEALIAHSRYDGVILDLCLTTGHGPDGLEIIPYIRSHCPDARLLVLSAVGAPDTQSEAIRLGADDYLQKPQGLAELHRHIRALIEPGTASHAS